MIENVELWGEEQTETLAAPVHQEKIFLIMWQSQKSGGTYSELRKSVQGKNRFLYTLQMMGVNLEDVIVTEQPKAWIPEKKSRQIKQKRQYRRREQTAWAH